MLGYPYQGPYNYFNGCNAAYIDAGQYAPVNAAKIMFPSDLSWLVIRRGRWTGRFFLTRSTRTRMILHRIVWVGAADPSLTEYWQVHSKGQNILFADGHSKWYKYFNAGDMTFGYNVMTNWMDPNG